MCQPDWIQFLAEILMTSQVRFLSAKVTLSPWVGSVCVCACACVCVEGGGRGLPS